MGIGKSTVSQRLSRHLYCKSTDLDRYIENIEGTSIDEIFRNKGEQYFREREEYCLNRLITENREKVLILSLGGGTLISQLNQRLVKDNTFCIYLKSSLKTQVDRLSKTRKTRPNIANIPEGGLEKEIEKLFEQRREGYENSCSLVIDVDGKSVKQILAEIIGSI